MTQIAPEGESGERQRTATAEPCTERMTQIAPEGEKGEALPS